MSNFKISKWHSKKAHFDIKKRIRKNRKRKGYWALKAFR